MAIEQDTVDQWLPAQDSRVVSLASVKAERAEQRAAVLAGREAASEARQASATGAEHAWRLRAQAADRGERGRQWREATVIGYCALVVLLTVPIWCAAMGWAGLALLFGLAVACALVAWLRWTGAW